MKIKKRLKRFIVSEPFYALVIFLSGILIGIVSLTITVMIIHFSY